MKQQNAASLSDIITEGIDKTLAKEMPNAAISGRAGTTAAADEQSRTYGRISSIVRSGLDGAGHS